METTTNTNDYKTKQLVARSIEEIAYTERSKISSYIFTSKEYELGRIIKDVKQLGIFASKVAETIEKSMVLSYQKESMGLNLQNFSYTIYFDKIWDLALRIQSGRRTFRTGQEYDCKYYDLTGDVGLEHLIDDNISKKVSMTEYFKGKTKEQLKEVL